MDTIDRRNITWALSRSNEYELNVYWTEPDRSGRGEPRQLVLAIDCPWQGWQIEGVLTSVASGAFPGTITVPDTPPPGPNVLLRALGRVADSAFDALDAFTRGHNMMGAR